MPSAICVTLNPCLHRCLFLPEDLPRARTFRVGGAFWLAGGKGVNVARVIRRLGGEAQALLFAGGVTGELLLDEMEREEIPVKRVSTAAPTRLGYFLYETGSNGDSWREILEESPRIADREGRSMLALFEELLVPDGWVCLSGSSPSPGADFLFAEMISMARQAGSQVVLDSYGAALAESLDRGPDLVKINRREVAATWGDGTDLEVLYRRLRRAGGGAMVVTAEAEPVHLFWGRRRIEFVPPRIGVVNPIGSGDCMAAAMIRALAEGWKMEGAVAYGVAAGSANAAKLHLCAIDRDEVEAFLPQVEVRKKD